MLSCTSLLKAGAGVTSNVMRGKRSRSIQLRAPVFWDCVGSRVSLRSFHSQDRNDDDPLPAPEFYVPRRDRSSHRDVFELDTLLGETRLSRNDRLCPTRELYFQHVQWGKHKSPYRKFRHVTHLLRSAPFQRLMFPDLVSVSAVALGVTYYNEIVQNATTVMSMSPTVFAGATTAIGLLAGFRLNASYGRYQASRQVWSDIQTTLRDFARQTLMWVPESSQEQVRLLRLCQAFPITLMFHLNDKGCHHNMRRLSRLGDEQFYRRVRAEFQAELSDVYYPAGCDTESMRRQKEPPSILNDDFERICQVKRERGNVPLLVITCMAESIASLTHTHNQDEHEHAIDRLLVRELDEKVQRLCKGLGGGERLLKTPIPTGFTRHSSRLLFLWSNSLPLALYPLLGPWGTLPASLLTSYAVLGIEDISVQLEESFDILPLRQFSNTIYDSIGAMERSFRPPPMPPISD